MKYKSIALAMTLLFSVGCSSLQTPSESEQVQLLETHLRAIADTTDNDLFKKHLQSISMVVNAETSISKLEKNTLKAMTAAFENDELANPSEWQSYLNRERMLMLAWKSPSDGQTSFSWMKLPKNYDPEKEYPLYVYLHGLWDVADEPITYLGFPFIQGPTSTTAFEDGFYFSPWGRGNQWYEGQSKTDIWEAIAELEKTVKIDQSRKYISGHSMGGYGAWRLALESPDVWAALGLHSAAWQYRDFKYTTAEYAQKLNKIPTYIVYGDQETGIAPVHQSVFRMLKAAGNENVEMITFEGGHDWNDADVERMYEWIRNFQKD